MRLGKFAITRRGITWMHETIGEDGVLSISYSRIPDWPKQYGSTIAIEPAAFEDAGKPVLARAYEALLQNAQSTDTLLRQKRRRGLDWSTLRFFYVAPTDDEPNTLVSWKAADGR